MKQHLDRDTQTFVSEYKQLNEKDETMKSNYENVQSRKSKISIRTNTK